MQSIQETLDAWMNMELAHLAAVQRIAIKLGEIEEAIIHLAKNLD